MSWYPRVYDDDEEEDDEDHKDDDEDNEDNDDDDDEDSRRSQCPPLRPLRLRLDESEERPRNIKCEYWVFPGETKNINWGE